MGINHGCPCHFAPALQCAHEFEYVLFADDDFLPGPEALSYMTDLALHLKSFATIGQSGRNFLLHKPEGLRYRGNSVPRIEPGGFGPCHLTCRSHLVRSDLLYHLLPFRQKFVRYGGEGKRLVNIHDDFLLCMGVQNGTGFQSFVANPQEPQCKLFGKELDTSDDKTSLWKRPGHFQERNRMVDMSLALGWKPLC